MPPIATTTDRISLVMLSISIWSGRKKLCQEDLHLSGGEIPVENLVPLGSKRICNIGCQKNAASWRGVRKVDTASAVDGYYSTVMASSDSAISTGSVTSVGRWLNFFTSPGQSRL